MIVAVHCFAIGVTTTMRDPYAGARAHHRFQCRNQTASGMLNFDPAVSSVLVNVRFAIGEDYDLFAVQMPV